jgi:intracellular septation protein
MKFLFDFFPVFLFFVAYYAYNIYVATAVTMVASFVQVALFWFKFRRFEKLHLITLVLVTLLGGLTLILQNEMFIKWKPTVVNWLFGVVFLGSHYVGKRPVVQRMMDHAIALPDAVWWRLNMGWVLFFFAMGAVNLYVVYHFDTDTWVNFKLFGMMGLTLVFIFLQAFYITRHVKSGDNAGEKH